MANYDFIGFTYNGKHSYRDLGIYRTIDGSRYNDNLTATLTDKTSDVPGGDGQYYFGTTFKNRTFTVQFAFDSLNELKLRELKQVFCGDGVYELIFDERPYQVWNAKVTGTASLKHICFEVDGERVYKGEGSITFTCYYPFAHTPTKLWSAEKDRKGNLIYSYIDADGRLLSNYDEDAYTNIEEWSEASGLAEKDTSVICGDIAAPFTFTIARNGTVWEADEDTKIYGMRIENSATVYFDPPINLSRGDELVWNSKTGLITKTKASWEGKELISKKNLGPVYYKGEGVVGLQPGTKVDKLQFMIEEAKEGEEEKWVTPSSITVNNKPLFEESIDYQFLYR
jgi:predicted phage tail component-like protein